MEAIVSPERMSDGLWICQCFPDNSTSSQTTLSTSESLVFLKGSIEGDILILPPDAPNSAEISQISHCHNHIMVVSVTSSEGGGIRTGGRNQLYQFREEKKLSWLPIGSFMAHNLLPTSATDCWGCPGSIKSQNYPVKTVAVPLLDEQKSND